MKQEVIMSNKESGTKYDHDKPMLVYNYWQGIMNFLPHCDFNFSQEVFDLKLVLDSAKNNNSGLYEINKILLCLKAEIGLDTLPIITEVSRVCKMGADKYGLLNYRKGIHYDRLLSAALRHYWKGLHRLDEESGLPHWAHLFSNLFMLIELIQLDKHRR